MHEVREGCQFASIKLCDFYFIAFQLHQENRKKGKKREKSVDEDDEESKREKLNKVWCLETQQPDSLI